MAPLARRVAAARQPPRAECGRRVDPRYVKVGDEYLDPGQHYKLVTKAYLASGR